MSKHAQLSPATSVLAIVFALASGVVVGHLAARSGNAAAGAEPVATTQDATGRYRIPVTDTQPSLGPADALVTVVEWCDLPDAGCKAVEPALQALLERADKDLIRLVFRHYARPEHAGSAIAHQFLRAAHVQGGKFWAARALLLDHKGELTLPDLERYAGQLGLDWMAVKAGIDKHIYAQHITADRLFADMFDVKAVPAIFVNGRAASSHPSQRDLERLVDEELAQATQLIAQGVPKADVYAELTKQGKWKKPTAVR